MTKPTLMIADDDVAWLESLRDLLKSEFEIVAHVGDGQALIEAAQALKPDLIIADISMPILNGLQAVRRLRATQPDTRVIFLTVHEESPFVTEARRSGGRGYVLKRCASSDLIPAIHEVLHGGSFVCSCVPVSE